VTPTVTARAATLVTVILRLATGVQPAMLNIGGWVVGALIAFAIFKIELMSPVSAGDEGLLLTYPWLMTRGVMPYHGFWASYPPMIYILLATLFKVTGPSLLIERAVDMAARLLVVLVVNRALTRSWVRVSWIGLPVTFALIMNPTLMPNPWIVGLPFLLLGLLAARAHPLIAVPLLVMAGTFRFEFGLVGTAALCEMATLPRHESGLPSQRCLLGSAIAVGATLCAFYLAVNALTGGDALQDIFLDPILVVAPGRRLPIIPPWIVAPYLPVEVVTVVGPLVMIAIALRSGQTYAAATILASTILLLQFFQRADATHLMEVAAVIIPWLLITLVRLPLDASGYRPRRAMAPRTAKAPRTNSRALAACAIVGLPIVTNCGTGYGAVQYVLAHSVHHGSPGLPRLASSAVVQVGRRAIVAGSTREAQDALEVARYLQKHGSARQNVFIDTVHLRHSMYNDTVLYYLLGMRPATRYLEMEPGLETQQRVQKEIIARLRDCPWIILWKGGFWFEPNASQVAGSPLLERFILGHYTLKLQNTTYKLYYRPVRTAENA